MWNETILTKMLGTEYPIIQAPMAGGATAPVLVSAVSNAGGLGFFAGGYLSAQQISAGIQAVRSLTDRPFGVNLLLPEYPVPDIVQIDRAHRSMQGIRDELDIDTVPAPAEYAPPFDDTMEAVLEARPAVFSFTFGILEDRWMQRVKSAGTIVFGTATTVEEASALEKAGVDAVVVQGSEAGSHRATFLGRVEDSLVGTMSLVPQTVDAVRIPVIASGGIMDARGIRAALTLGATGVQMGTAFLAADECGISAAYKEVLLAAGGDHTTLTRVFSGKVARGLRNRFIDEMRPFEQDLPPYPIQNALTQDIRKTAARLGRAEFLSLWAGQGVGQIQAKSAAALIEEWVRE